MALSKKYRASEDRRRRELIRRLADADPQFVKMLVKFYSETDCNRSVSEYFGLGKTSDRESAHRKNLRGLRLRRNKLAASDIAYALEGVGFSCPAKDVTPEEWEAFLRLTTLLYSLLEVYS